MAAGKIVGKVAKYLNKKLGGLPSDAEVDVSKRNFIKKGAAAPLGGLAALGGAALAVKSLRKLFSEGKFDKIISGINNKFQGSAENYYVGDRIRQNFDSDGEFIDFIRESDLVPGLSGFKNLDEFLDEFYEATDDSSVIANGLQRYLDDTFENTDMGDLDLGSLIKSDVKAPLLKNKILKIHPELKDDPELDKLTYQLVD